MLFFSNKSNEYCFIHIPKTAGTSFQNTILKNNTDNKKNNLLFKNYMDQYNCRYDHAPFSFLINNFFTNIKLDTKIKYITIVRNPWNRMASLFEQIILRDKVGLRKISQSNEIRNKLHYNYENLTNNFLNDLGFYNSDKIKNLFKFWLFYIGYDLKIIPNFNPNFNILSQSWWFMNEQTNQTVDEIFLFEDLKTLEEEFNILLLHDNKKKTNLNYKDYYDQETIDYVANLDKITINKYNYDF